MSDLDKEFNERFQYQKSSSDDIEIENLWGAVESELDDKSNDRAFYYPILLGALLLIFLTAGITYWVVAPAGQETAVSVDTSQENIVSRLIEVQENCPEISVENESKSNRSTVDAELETRKNDFTANENSLSIIDKVKSKFDKNVYAELKKEGTETSAKQSLDEGNFYSKNTLSTREIGAETIFNSGDLDAAKVPTSITSGELNPPLTPTPLIDTKKFMPEDREQSMPGFGVIVLQEDSTDNNESKIEDKSKKINFTVGVNGGVNWSNQNFKDLENSTFADLRNSSESGDFGQSYGVDFAVIFKDRWIIQSGLEYHKFWSKFDYFNTTSEQVLKENQLTKVWLDGSDTLRTEYRDVLTNRNTTREVIHHNQYTQISIPLEIGLKNRTGKFTYGMTLGTSFNFLLNQYGKAFDDTAEIVEYDDASANKPLSDFEIGLRFSPFVGYHLSEKIVLGLKPNVMLQQHKANGGTNISTNLQQFGLKLGLEIGF